MLVTEDTDTWRGRGGASEEKVKQCCYNVYHGTIVENLQTNGFDLHFYSFEDWFDLFQLQRSFIFWNLYPQTKQQTNIRKLQSCNMFISIIGLVIPVIQTIRKVASLVFFFSVVLSFACIFSHGGGCSEQLSLYTKSKPFKLICPVDVHKLKGSIITLLADTCTILYKILIAVA